MLFSMQFWLIIFFSEQVESGHHSRPEALSALLAYLPSLVIIHMAPLQTVYSSSIIQVINY